MLLDPERKPPSRGEEEAEPPPSSTLAAPPVLLEPRGNRPPPLVFRQGAHPPFGIRWYGVTSLFGHLRNFTARAIATESVDARDWMRPSTPEEVLEGACSVLDAPSPGPTLVEALGRPIWIDFVADTGDDRDVSAGVGAMLATTYEVRAEDGTPFLLPRGDVLVFGGDVSYPVSTADEIYKRLVLPWNEQLRKIGASSKKRVLLGVPGNHDWYDGLDGFGRLFRRRMDEKFRADDRDPSSRLGQTLRKRPGRKLGLVARQLHLDEVGGLYGILLAFVKSVRAFFRGVAIRRRRRLVLRGYVPVQESSYFALPLAPGLDMWGADRQLGRVDFRQRAFFGRRRKSDPTRSIMFVSGDPAVAFGHRNDPGARMLGACRLNMERDCVLYLAGDFHHYERRTIGRSMHVIAGGGGAFLHGTRIVPYPKEIGEPDVVYPTGPMTRALALQVPWKLAIGRGGFLVHLAAALFASFALGAGTTLVSTAIFCAIAYALLVLAAHQGHGRKRIASLAVPFALTIGLLPTALRLAIPTLPWHVSDGAVLVVYAMLASLVFGTYLMLLAILGLEHQQAFTVLGHPGYKHFVRLCVHADGKVEAWTIGKDDVLAEGPPHLVDSFVWQASRPPRTEKRASRRPPPP